MNVPAPTPPPPASPHFPWLWFFAAMLGAPVLTLIAVMLGANAGDLAPTIVMIGGSAGGIICGVLLGKRFGKSVETRIVLGLVLSAIMVVVCVTMSCFGCLAGGYQLNFH